MALSEDMARLSKLERDVGEMKGAVVLLTHTAVEQSERLDTLTHRLDRLTDRVDSGFRTLADRLDRLIAVTIDERTRSYDRMHDLEKRVERLEERAGIT